jgi:hypothetical protein
VLGLPRLSDADALLVEHPLALLGDQPAQGRVRHGMPSPLSALTLETAKIPRGSPLACHQVTGMLQYSKGGRQRVMPGSNLPAFGGKAAQGRTRRALGVLPAPAVAANLLRERGIPPVLKFLESS